MSEKDLSMPDDWEAIGQLLEVYCDLNARMTENGYSLERRGSIDTLAGHGLTLEGAVGLRYRFFMDDADDDGNLDDIMFVGHVVVDPQYGYLAIADDDHYFHRSELVRALSR